MRNRRAGQPSRCITAPVHMRALFIEEFSLFCCRSRVPNLPAEPPPPWARVILKWDLLPASYLQAVVFNPLNSGGVFCFFAGEKALW